MNEMNQQIESLEKLASVLAGANRPVVLVEGIRALPEADHAMVVAFGRWLAERLPGGTFRSGNAEGTDTAFSEGVTSVDPARMQYVMTHPGMGRKRRHPAARAVSLDQLSPTRVDTIGQATVEASPDSVRLVQSWKERGGKGPLAGKAQYLLRDTLKVVGAAELDLEPAIAGIFYVNQADPISGGTGHTIRVCRQQGVPVVMQDAWRSWQQ